ncbi:MAG: molecular chaperone TorD family protein [Bacteroidia bacterium]|nr:molecular chaperone TorD family protein [Bacteroidia bacterium]
MKTKEKTDLRLLKADLYRLLANCFDFPTKDRLAAIKELTSALNSMEFPDEEIANIIYTLSDSIDESEIVNDYSLIFISGGVPLNESHTCQKFSSVSDVNAFYKAFGFSPKTGENPDAIMYELEFLALLLIKIAIAPNEETKEVTEKAYRDFLEEHFGEFSLALAKRIRDGKAGNYFFTVSFLLEAFITQELITK